VVYSQSFERRAALRRISVVLTVLVVLSRAASLWADHSPSAIFEMSKRFALTCTVTKVDWVDPHFVVFIDAQGGSGTESWKFESNPPARFRRVGVGGIDFSKAIGQTVTVQGVRAKDGSLYGYLQKITLPDGSTSELGNPDDVK
jgi:Family of unknown function (DUF6152)